jgi:hypothetical protein
MKISDGTQVRGNHGVEVIQRTDGYFYVEHFAIATHTDATIIWKDGPFEIEATAIARMKQYRALYAQ